MHSRGSLLVKLALQTKDVIDNDVLTQGSSCLNKGTLIFILKKGFILKRGCNLFTVVSI